MGLVPPSFLGGIFTNIRWPPNTLGNFSQVPFHNVIKGSIDILKIVPIFTQQFDCCYFKLGKIFCYFLQPFELIMLETNLKRV
jgi:hypothetical protein